MAVGSLPQRAAAAKRRRPQCGQRSWSGARRRAPQCGQCIARLLPPLPFRPSVLAASQRIDGSTAILPARTRGPWSPPGSMSILSHQAATRLRCITCGCPALRASAICPIGCGGAGSSHQRACYAPGAKTYSGSTEHAVVSAVVTVRAARALVRYRSAGSQPCQDCPMVARGVRPGQDRRPVGPGSGGATGRGTTASQAPADRIGWRANREGNCRPSGNVTRRSEP